MSKSRMEAFSDGVIAVIITIMVLEMKSPHGASLAALWPLVPVFLSYVLSFVYIGIYWNNHHHLWHIVDRVNGKLLWANLHLLFWLSLFPFATDWMGENHFSTWPVAFYGFILMMAGVAYYIMTRSLIKLHGKESDLARAYGKDVKGRISVAIYMVSIFIAFYSSWLSFAMYAVVALIWLRPDPRIERILKN